MTDVETNNQTTPKTTFFQRMKGYILIPHISPRRVALSFAIGLSIAMSPLVGLQTWIALGCCYFVKSLHRPLLLATSLVNNPWTFAPFASVNLILGNLILGQNWAANLSKATWESIGLNSFITREGLGQLAVMMRPLLAPFLLGGFALSLLSIFLGYWLMLHFSRRARRGASDAESQPS
ncbi:MAG: DUF2062 domain-containing protein [Holophagales bacterium]|jgi:uncharacterized protein (DUF2062 family)|nr:DUF2062 domain-containing protein [Holophagales bacterium]